MTKTAAMIGGGVIGGGWAARFVLMGWDVNVFDPDPEAERKISEVMANAERALPAVIRGRMPKRGTIRYYKKLEDAVAGASWIQESVPERIDLKHKVIAQIQAACDEGAILASSTSGFTPTELQQGAARPAQIIVAHPYNPVYLLPILELVGDPQTCARADAIAREIGMVPITIAKDIDAHIGDRLLEAVWREALWMIRDGIATTSDIDTIMTHGFGLRWAQMGLFETYRVAGGEAGMKHFIAQFGPCLSLPWTRLTDVPEMTDDLVDMIADQSDEQSGAYSIRQLERIRDRNLIGFLNHLKANDWSAGKALNAFDAGRLIKPEVNNAQPLRLWFGRVLPEFLDYNGHMTEHRYLQVFGEATDEVLKLIGVEPGNTDATGSYFTVETHIRHLGEGKEGEELRIETQVISADEKRLHLYHRLFNPEGAEIATAEHLCIHVKDGKACPASDAIRAVLDPLAAAHAQLPRPEAAGRHVGQRKN